VNLVLAVLVWADLGRPLHVRGRAVPQGYLVGVAAAVKLVPLIYLLYLLVIRRFRIAITGLATFVGCIVLGFAVNPHGSWLYWTKYVDDSSRMGNVFYISNQSLLGALDRLAGRQLPTVPIDVLAVIVMGFGLVLADRVGREDALLALVVVSATGDVVSPITWVHHLVWVVPLLVWMTFAPTRPRLGRWWALAVFAVLWWSPVFRVPYGNRRELSLNGWQQVLGNAYFFMMVALLLLVALWVKRRGIGRSPRTRGSPAHGNTAHEVNSKAVIATSASAEATARNV
jgi:alpha-1,2-mannosyltransferase